MNKDHNINNEEDNALPGNHSEHPFRTGSSYFDNFSERLSGRIGGLEEIKEIAPVLFRLPKYNPFETPADYFEELPARVNERKAIAKERDSLADWLIMIIRPRFVIPVAATLFFAIAGINYLNRHSDLPQQAQTEEISLEEHLYDIDEATIIDQLTSDGTAETENADDNNIRDYLIDNNIDETNLEL